MAKPESPAANRTLSEHESKQLLARYGVPIATERIARDADAAARAATEIGFPVVVKLCGDAIAHKTERDLVRLGLADAEAVRGAAAELLAKARPEDGAVALLVAEMVRGKRELIAGLVRDPQFGSCVLLGLGGILTEALGDVVFAAAPLEQRDALAMIGRLRASHLLTKPFRGEAAVDAGALASVLVGLGRLAAERPDVVSVGPESADRAQRRPATGGRCAGRDWRREATCRSADSDAAALGRRTPRALPAALPAARDHRGGRVHAPGQVRLRGAPQPARLRVSWASCSR